MNQNFNEWQPVTTPPQLKRADLFGAECERSEEVKIKDKHGNEGKGYFLRVAKKIEIFGYKQDGSLMDSEIINWKK